MSAYDINDIVGDFDEFRSEYLNKKPMLRRNALPDVARDVLSLADVDTLLNLEIVRFPYIKVNLNGSGVPEAGYTKDMVVQGMTITGVVDPERVHALYRAGGTITWASVNHIFPKVRDFIRTINNTMAVRTDAVAFLTPAEKKGYPAHHDGVDLFIVQLSGSKRWRLWSLADDRRSESASYTDETLGTPVIEESLKPGDVLYLPYGTPHATAAEGEPSLHLSIMMRPRMWRDLFKETVAGILADEEFLSYPPLCAEMDDSIRKEFSEKMTALISRISAIDPETEWAQYRKAGRAMPGTSTSSVFVESAAAINSATALRRTASKFNERELEDGRIQIDITGLKFAVSSKIADKIRVLEPGALVTPQELMSGAPAERQHAAARALVRMGLFAVAV